MKITKCTLRTNGKKIRVEDRELLGCIEILLEGVSPDGNKSADRLTVKYEGGKAVYGKNPENEKAFADIERFMTACDNGLKPTVQRYHSFSGGGPEYSMKLHERGIFTYFCNKEYNQPGGEFLCGGGFDYIYRLYPLRQGKAAATITASSPICPQPPIKMTVEVNDKLEMTISQEVKKDERFPF